MKKRTFTLMLFVSSLVALLGMQGCATHSPKPDIFEQRARILRSTTYKNNVPCDAQSVQGYGEISKLTGRPRINIVRGHWRHTSKGLIWINSYARS